MNKYFVSFSYTKQNLVIGEGRVTMYSKPICDMEDIKKIEEALELEYNYLNVFVTYWRRFEQPE